VTRFFDLSLNGVTNGMIYAAVALGLVLIWRATHVINFAAGAIATFTTYIAVTLVDRNASYWLALVVALAAGFVIGAVAERILIRPVESKPPVNAVIVTIGLFIAVEGLTGILYGGGFRSFPAEFSQAGLSVGGRQIAFSRFDAFTLASVILLSLLLLVLFRATPAGLRMRASAFAPEVARLLGVRVGRTLTMGWALATLAASLAGVLVAPKVLLYPSNMESVLVFGFAAAVIGGLDSPIGAVIGGVLTGLAISWVGGYLGSSLEPLGAFALLVVVLMIRPQGLFSRAQVRAEHGAPAPPQAAPATAGMAAAATGGGGRLRIVRTIQRVIPQQPLVRHLAFAVLAGVLLFALTEVLSPFRNYQLANVGIYVIAVAGLTLLTGANGQISLGHGAFMAVGAYVTALLLLHTGVPLAVAVLASGAAAAVFGVIAGIAAARLRGPYLAGLTLALAVGLPELAVKYGNVFGGEEGLSVPPAQPPSSDIDPERWIAWLMLATALLVLVVIANLMRSRFGRAFRAVRDDEIASALAGIHVARTQVIAFVVSGACAGLAGALLGVATSIANPGEFAASLSISLLAGMVIGGTGSLIGAWWGGLILVFVPDWATSLSGQFHLSSGQSSNLALIMYGAALVVVIIVAPAGIQGIVRRIGRLALRFGGDYA
jgi:branched-chain amino acid transport system permease protein